MYIYKITNIKNSKFYIGKTAKSNIDDRWRRHIYDSKKYKSKLYNAINKYGKKCFTIEVIEEINDISLLNEREKYWIKSLEPEYNMTEGGDGGWIHDQTGKTWIIKDTSNMKGKKTVTDKVIMGRLKVSSGLNYQSKFIIHTPWGVFETWKDATDKAATLRQRGRRDVITDNYTLKKYCFEDIILSIEGRRTFPAWRGKSTKELGFFIKEKDVKN